MLNIKWEVTGVKHIKENCMSCVVVLITPDNWYLSRVKKREYRCISCFDHKRLENRIKRGENSPSLYAKFFGIKHEKEYASIKEGFVYVITNPAWKGWIKVGMALDAKDRCKQYQTSSPLRDYKLHYSKFFNNRKTAEKKAHELLNKIFEQKGEWFKSSSINEAIKLIETI